jgi:hypothetical protein
MGFTPQSISFLASRVPEHLSLLKTPKAKEILEFLRHSEF